MTLRQLADEAGIDDGYLGQIERGIREASLTVLVAVATALGGDASVRLYPGTGPRLRDPIQARIVEELLRIAHPRWQRHVEVPVHRPARGVIDVVLRHRDEPVVVAVEVHSELRRLEQQLRWANEKAESLPSATVWDQRTGGVTDQRPPGATDLRPPGVTDLRPPGATDQRPPGATDLRTPDDDRPVIHRLLVLRMTRTNRDLATRFAATLATAYPAPPGDASRALTDPACHWPGSALLWATLHDDRATIVTPATRRATSHE